MATREQIVDRITRYCAAVGAADPAAAAACFAEDGYREDPVGARPQQGRAAIQAFFEKAFSVPMGAERIGAITIVEGQGAAFQIRIDVGGSSPMTIAATDVVEVDDEGLFTTLRAWQDLSPVLE